MKYVLDSNVALKTVLPEDDSVVALRLVAEHKQGLHELMAPDVFPVELGHALTKAERQRRISPPDGWTLWQSIMTDAPNLHPYLPLIERAFDLSSSKQIGLYDCLYVALAEREQCCVVSADRRLANSFPSIVVLLASL